jgi:hypothetical protein
MILQLIHTLKTHKCGICGRQSGTEAGFLQVFRFPLPIFIPPTAPQSPSSVIWGWHNRPVVATVPSGLSLTPLRRHINKHKKLKSVMDFYQLPPSIYLLSNKIPQC